MILEKKFYERYVFTIDNKNMRGLWIGEFHALDENKIELIFTEEVEFKNAILKFIGKFMNIKKFRKHRFEI